MRRYYLTTVGGAAAFGPAAWNRSQGIDEEADNDLRKILLMAT